MFKEIVEIELLYAFVKDVLFGFFLTEVQVPITQKQNMGKIK